MFEPNNLEKQFFLEKGYLVKKNILTKNLNFEKISKNFKNELEKLFDIKHLKNLGGFKSGNLNIYPGKFGEEILSLLNNYSFKEYLNYLIDDNIEKYKVILGGNLNLPKSKNQFFHTDGKWDPRMIVVNIATSNIELLNGPLEIIEKTHLNKLSYWQFALKIIFMSKKKLTLGFGDILIREHRLWHRGTTNFSVNNREMIGIMFIKKPNDSDKIIDKNLYIKPNIFGETLKERIKENIFIYLRPILFLYKFFISMIK